MNKDKINKLKAYLNNSGFKKEASLLALLFACKPMKSHEEPVSLFTLSQEFTRQDFNEQLSKISEEELELYDEEIDIINFYMQGDKKNKIYKNLELSHCYVNEQEMTLMSEWNNDKILIEKYVMQFSCIPIASEEISMTIGGRKFVVIKDLANEVSTQYDENNQITTYNDGEEWKGETTYNYETGKLEEKNDSYLIFAKIIKYFFKETETEVYSLELISDTEQIPLGNCHKNKLRDGDPNVPGFGNANFGTRDPI